LTGASEGMDRAELTTVVIPVHNGANYLSEAVESVKRQTLGAPRVVIVDDGSTDATSEVAASLPDVIYVRQQHAGVAAALNHGVRLGSGKFISFVSADDVWCPDKLALQHAALAAPDGKLVFGHMKHFISPEIDQEVAARLHCPTEPMPAFSAGTMLASLDTVRSIGPFDESFTVGEFMDWYGRARDLRKEIVMLPDIVAMRRVHGANYSTKALRTETYLPVLKALLDRRRGTT
jgi:glycosyltransferase involved in cell wall biosynthesis